MRDKKEREYELRQEAVRRYLSKESPISIYSSLRKNKQWFYYWLGRYYGAPNEDWYKDLPHANKSSPWNKTDEGAESLVVNIRKRLTQRKYSQFGAVAIQWEMEKLGVEDIPPISTINSILKRNELVKPRSQARWVSQGKYYNMFEVCLPNDLQQFDLVGPRNITRDGRFYSYNLIDLFTHRVALDAFRDKKSENIVGFLISTWQKLGIPKVLQMDNELSFKGSNRYPRSFGDVIHLCLFCGVEIAFIPPSEPWWDGTIEKFNDTYDKLFFTVENFKDFQDLRIKSANFVKFHNSKHIYSVLKGKTPDAVPFPKEFSLKLLPKDSQLPLKKHRKPLPDGKVSFIRFVNKDAQITINTEHFKVEDSLIYEYVLATIFVKEQSLRIFYKNELVKELDYKL